jgi:O-antigen/teichoic acid export membrane protein
VKKYFGGDSLKAKTVRTSSWVIISLGGGNLIRLASNLILTRILLPEAFGLMALVQVFVAGLKMFSDTGVRISIMRSERGEDPDFLNTAWTVQLIRGVLLWLLCCAIAIPAAALYDAPMLAQLLPIVGLSNIVAGLTTTNIATANRKLILGRTTVINLSMQLFGTFIMVCLAYALQSIWALVIGGLISSTAAMLMQHRMVPGIRNRLHLETDAFWELFHFGKFLFISTAVTFVITQGDKAVLGSYITPSELGVYAIGAYLGTIPVMLVREMNGKLVFPLYRMRPMAESADNRRKVFRVKRLIIAASLVLTFAMSYGGIALVDLLYDDRYALAGSVVVVMGLTLVQRIVMTPYADVLNVVGDSRAFFILTAMTAVCQTVFLFAGVIWFGILGVLLAPMLATALTNPLRIYYARKYKSWDPMSDLFFLSTGLIINGLACWYHWEEIVKLL